MSELKCPICNTNLEVLVGGANALLGCPRCRDKATDGVWQELIRTRKALEIAKDKLDTVRQYHRGTAVIRPDDIAAYCDRALEQITTEQKDVK